MKVKFQIEIDCTKEGYTAADLKDRVRDNLSGDGWYHLESIQILTAEPKTKIIPIFTAAELKAKHAAGFTAAHQSYVSDVIHQEPWFDSVYDDFLTIAGILGFTVARGDIAFSGFSSQGDGASFTGSAVFLPDAVRCIKEHAPLDETLHHITDRCGRFGVEGIHARLTRHGSRYYHAQTVDVEAFLLEEGEEVSLTSGYASEVTVCCRDLMDWLYRRLEREYEHVTSEEVFLEVAASNGWEYNQAGKME